jgi:hypothetical protein
MHELTHRLTNTGAFITTTTFDETTAGVLKTNVIILSTGTSFIVPVDWNSSNNTIHLFGAGGGGGGSRYGVTSQKAGGSGGGGGGYTKITNFQATPGTTITYSLGVGGSAGTSAANGGNGTATSWNSNQFRANGGFGGISYSFTTGSDSIPGQGGTGLTYNGGAGGRGNVITFGISLSGRYCGGGGGGGAGGPLGNGGTGGRGNTSIDSASDLLGGGGGGGNGGGSNGQSAIRGGADGNGGNNAFGYGGGIANTSVGVNANGTFGGGGAGGSGFNVNQGGIGGSGIDISTINYLGLLITGGSGGGAGGQATSGPSAANTGGLFGGGGGGAYQRVSSGYSGTAGANGGIIIEYTYGNPKFVSKIANNAVISLLDEVTYSNIGSITNTLPGSKPIFDEKFVTNIANSDFTIEAWVYPKTKFLNNTAIGAGNTQIIVAQDDGVSNNESWQLYLTSTNNVEFLYYTSNLRTSNAVVTSTTSLSNNTWYHIAVVDRSNNLTIYIDGANSGYGVISPFYGNNPTFIGSF